MLQVGFGAVKIAKDRQAARDQHVWEQGGGRG